jgi:hypothetical protein
MNLPPSHPRRDARQGFALLAVLVFIMLLSMLTVSLMFRSKSDETAAAAGAGTEQAWAAAMSGVQEALRVAAAATPGSIDWQDNPASFRDRPVFEDGADQWFFTVYSPTGSDDTVELRYGLDSEASRVNLNYPGLADLGRIPRMTPAMVQAVRSFVGAGTSTNSDTSSVGQSGATPTAIPSEGDLAALEPVSSAGDTLGAAIAALSLPVRHGPLSTLEDVLRVPGFSWSLLHGEDANLNGHLDANEDDGDERFPPDNHDGRLDHGMAQYFSVVSYDPDRTSQGRRRTNLNDPKEPLPAGEFPAGFTNFVAAMRAAGQKLAHPADLLEAKIKVKDSGGNEVELGSGITKTELPTVLDLFTTDTAGRHDGLIDVNTASSTVLATLPGIDPAIAETIVSTRTSVSASRRTTTAWLVQEGVVDAEKFKALAPSITARSRQFRFQVLGYGVPSGRFCVLQAVIDAGGDEPRVIELRDITRLGLPFKPGPENTGTDSGTKQTAMKAEPIQQGGRRG